MSHIRIKICGITREEDALVAAEAGADAIGLVFYAPSSRAVSIERARAILRVLPPFVSSVGLFVNAGRDEVNRILERVPLDLLQFHGDEEPEACRGFSRPYIKALRVRPDEPLLSRIRLYGDAVGMLLDAYMPGIPGGTGRTFDWSLIPHDPGSPLILAGGLTPENVALAVRSARPYAVDVSGGVESAPGIKDANKVVSFICSARGS